MNIQTKVIFTIEDLIKSQQMNLIALSDNASDKVLKNQKNRLKSAKAFTKASDKALNFIISYSDEVTLESLIKSDDKTACCNYKTALRILQLAEYLVNEDSRDTTILTMIANFNAIKKQHDTLTVSLFVSKLYSVEQMSKNFVRALHFFNLIDAKVNLRSNNKFIDVMRADQLIAVK